HIALGVNPDRRPRESGMPERPFRHHVPRRVAAIRLLPSECPIGHLTSREQLDRLGTHDPHTIQYPTIQIHSRESPEIVRRAENAGMCGHATQVIRALVMYDPPHLATANRIDLRGSNARLERLRGPLHRLAHPQWPKDTIEIILIDCLTR